MIADENKLALQDHLINWLKDENTVVSTNFKYLFARDVSINI
jgi:hypothetical protein